jgi:YcxB-like protein
MIEVTYRFEHEHLQAYRRLASNRVDALHSDADMQWWIWMIAYPVLAAALLAAECLILPKLTGRPFAWPELLLGLAGGIAVCIALMWRRYRWFYIRAVRRGGPTMAEHHTIVSADGLTTETDVVQAMYRWGAFDGVTVKDGIIVLWLEPGAGLLVPCNAFAGPEAETAFLDTVRSHVGEAKGST